MEIVKIANFASENLSLASVQEEEFNVQFVINQPKNKKKYIYVDVKKPFPKSLLFVIKK